MTNSSFTRDPPQGPNSLFVRDKLALTVAGVILAVSAFSWIASYYLMPFMMMQQMTMMYGVAAIVSSLSPSSIAFFELVWIVGMAAMMFPAMIPIVLFYNKVATRLVENKLAAKIIGTPLFLSGYLIVYALLGICAYLAVFGALNIPQSLFFFSSSLILPVASGGVLIVAGLYQFSTIKTKCLSNCVSPIGFFSLHFHRGLAGSVRMGLAHGLYCVGCCWAYMIVMLALGAMSIPVMAILAAVIAVEKVLAKGSVWFNRIVALGFIALGFLVFVYPGILGVL